MNSCCVLFAGVPAVASQQLRDAACVMLLYHLQLLKQELCACELQL
jgi:hypothetical protein